MRSRAQAPLPSRQPVDCVICAPAAHHPRRHAAALAKAKKFAAVNVGPISVAAGDRFIVVEDFEDATGCYRADHKYRATKPTGRAVGGYDEWWMLCLIPGGGRRRAFPQLHPFFKLGGARGANLNIGNESASPGEKKYLAIGT